VRDTRITEVPNPDYVDKNYKAQKFSADRPEEAATP
jgi:hypothetical protein